ncbi:AAA family ATPase [Clostridium sp. D2Q-11]|uniref:Nuclease SbcCD subunit C n=1 Tax=Anaeromonas frigoriresistens TaxID=2683708 RepID=A0A942UXH9_9FIRM|nr:AAA family ATPase [Anaeromonas frigoriresistens]MBS4539910.1 AAA family ATPase [Anaeromonas frigoriresistens]
MKHITQVEISNFQSHKKTKIDFVNGLNVIVGPSDQGKTAIIRAIRWVLYNEPLGNFFIRHGESEASVVLTFNTGEKVKRLRSNSKNLYIYINETGEEEIYEGFGLSTPIDIVEKLNIRKIHLDSKESSSINIGEQLEGPFLMAQKNSTRANAIGRLVGVHVVDKAVQNTIKDTRSLNVKNKSLKDDIDALESKLSRYEYLESLEKQIVTLETIQLAINDKENILSQLMNIKEQMNNNIKEIKNYNDIILSLSEINTVENYISNLDDNLYKIKSFTKLKGKLSDVNDSIDTNRNTLKKLKELSSIESLTITLEEKIKISQNLVPKHRKHTLLVNEIKSVSNISNRLDNINHLNNIYQSIEHISKSLNKLTTYNNNLNKIISSIRKGKVYIDSFDDINKVELLYNDIVKKEEKINILTTLIRKLNKLNTEKNNTILLYNKEKLKQQNLLYEYKDLLKTIEKCPLCFNEISNEDMERIVNNLI